MLDKHYITYIESLKTLDSIIAYFDQIALLAERQYGHPLCIRCGNCCTVPLAFQLEADRLMKGSLDKRSKYDYSMILDISRQWVTRPREGFICHTAELQDNPEQRKALAEQLSNVMHEKCPFFSTVPENHCMIYEIRPLQCRAYGLFTLDENCSRPVMPLESASERFTLVGSQQHAEITIAVTKLVNYMLEQHHIDLSTIAPFPFWLAYLGYKEELSQAIAAGDVPLASRTAVLPDTVLPWRYLRPPPTVATATATSKLIL